MTSMRTPSRQRPHRNRPGAERTRSRPSPVQASGAAESPSGAGPGEATDAPPTAIEAPRRPTYGFKISHVRPIGVRKINMMVYGPYGHGKTFFAGTAVDEPSMRDVLFIAAEPGDMSLTDRRDLDIVYMNKYDEIAEIYKYLVHHAKWRDEGNVERMLEAEMDLKSEIIPLEEQTAPAEEGRTWFEEQRLRTGKPMDEPYMYRTVIIDSLSEVHKYLVYKYTGVDIGKTKLNEDIEKMDEWQSAQELFRLFIRSFRDLPMNSIFVSAEAIEPTERNKRRNPLAGQSLPKLAGQMAGDIAGFIDIVGYLYREIGKDGEITRHLYLGAGYDGWISKHRFVNLPDLEELTNPTLSTLLDLARKDEALHGSTNTPGSGSASSNVTSRSNATGPAAAQRRNKASGSGPGSGAGRGQRALRRRV